MIKWFDAKESVPSQKENDENILSSYYVCGDLRFQSLTIYRFRNGKFYDGGEDVTRYVTCWAEIKWAVSPLEYHLPNEFIMAGRKEDWIIWCKELEAYRLKCRIKEVDKEIEKLKYKADMLKD